MKVIPFSLFFREVSTSVPLSNIRFSESYQTFWTGLILDFCYNYLTSKVVLPMQ